MRPDPSPQPCHLPFRSTSQRVCGTPAVFLARLASSTFQAHQATAPYLYAMSPVSLCQDRTPRQERQRSRGGTGAQGGCVRSWEPSLLSAQPCGVGFLCACARARVCMREPGPRVEAPVSPRESLLALPPLAGAAPPVCLQLVSGTGAAPGRAGPAHAPPPWGRGQSGALWRPRTAPGGVGGVGGVVASARAGGHRKLCEASVVAEGSSELDALAVTQ